MPLPLAALLAPSIISGVGSIFSGAGKGSAEERTKQNQFLGEQGRTKANLYGTQQGALLNSLLAQGRDKLQGYETRQGATLDALQGLQGAHTAARAGESAEKIALAKLGLEAPTAAARQSILGSLMKNMQPHAFVSPSGQRGHLTSVSGGMSAANLDPLTRQHGDALLKAALEKQLSGGGLPGPTDFRGGIQDWSKAVLDVPEATDYSKGLLAPPELADYKKAGRGESILSGLGMGLGIAGEVAGGIQNARGAGSSDGGGGWQPRNYPTDAAQPTAYGFKLPRIALEEAFANPEGV
jgi:hypothetical protein